MGVKPFLIQRRMMTLGRVRMGEKSSSGAPKKLDTFRFTSASAELLASVAAKYGGTVKPWQGAPDEGYFEVVTETAELDIVLPPVFAQADGAPTVPYSQWLELWSAGGCQRRCDGVTEAISGEACMCDPDARQCQITTRISFLMPDIRGLGVWRLDSHGWNAAAELPGTLEILHQAAAQGKFIPATLRIEHRTKKSDGQTRRFIVPVVELRDVTIEQLARGEVPLAINAPAPSPDRPALPAGAPEPANHAFTNGEPGHGPPPALPERELGGTQGIAGTSRSPQGVLDGDAPPSRSESADDPSFTPLTDSEFKELCQHDHIATEEVQRAGGELFPGKSYSRLTKDERGQLWAVLSA
jgi:hypothetical protein